jgi:hypothetical protein
MTLEFKSTAVVTTLISFLSGCAAQPSPSTNLSQAQINVNFNGQGQLAAQKNITRGAISGEPQHVGFYYSVNPDCSSGGLVRTQLKSPPQHGFVTFDNADGYTGFPSTSPGHECNSKKSPGVEVIYTSAKNFVGTDQFTVQGVGPKGKYMETDYTVKVIPP